MDSGGSSVVSGAPCADRSGRVLRQTPSRDHCPVVIPAEAFAVEPADDVRETIDARALASGAGPRWDSARSPGAARVARSAASCDPARAGPRMLSPAAGARARSIDDAAVIACAASARADVLLNG